MSLSIPPGRRDGAILVTIHLFGLSYFSFFLAYFLIWHFPKSPESIGTAQSVVVYSGGVTIWCLSNIAHRILCIFRGDQVAPWQRLELAGALVLICTTAIPFAILQFSEHIYFRVTYLCCLAMVAVEKIASTPTMDLTDGGNNHLFHYHCVSMGMVAVVPAIHALCDLSNGLSAQTTNLIRFAGVTSLGALCHLIRLPERSGLVGNWRPSFYIMHLVVVLNSIWYSKEVLKFSA